MKFTALSFVLVIGLLRETQAAKPTDFKSTLPFGGFSDCVFQLTLESRVIGGNILDVSVSPTLQGCEDHCCEEDMCVELSYDVVTSVCSLYLEVVARAPDANTVTCIRGPTPTPDPIQQILARLAALEERARKLEMENEILKTETDVQRTQIDILNTETDVQRTQIDILLSSTNDPDWESEWTNLQGGANSIRIAHNLGVTVFNNIVVIAAYGNPGSSNENPSNIFYANGVSYGALRNTNAQGFDVNAANANEIVVSTYSGGGPVGYSSINRATLVATYFKVRLWK